MGKGTPSHLADSNKTMQPVRVQAPRRAQSSSPSQGPHPGVMRSPGVAPRLAAPRENKEVMVVWSYPGVTGTPLEAALAAQAEVFCGHAAVEAAAQPGRKPSAAYFSKHGGTWMYGCV